MKTYTFEINFFCEKFKKYFFEHCFLSAKSTFCLQKEYILHKISLNSPSQKLQSEVANKPFHTEFCVFYLKKKKKKKKVKIPNQIPVTIKKNNKKKGTTPRWSMHANAFAKKFIT